MNQLLLLAGVVIVACILMNRIAAKLPLPSLLLFIGLGMCFGVDGFFKIPFDDYELSEAICSVSLLFVMFYGGFGTNLKTAKPVMGKAFLLSTAGVVMTAALVGAAAHVLLGVGWMEGILIGSVIASTDAASVFNVLRSKQLSLKYNTDSLLELESGSNDPISYMMTILMISLVSGEQISVAGLLLKQILIGAACGFLIGKASVFILNQIDFGMKQGRTIFLFAAVIVGYALPSVAGGNGYLSVYLCGILIGNRFIPDRDCTDGYFLLAGIACNAVTAAGSVCSRIAFMSFYAVYRASGVSACDIKAVWCILAADRRCFLGRIAGSGIDCVFYLCCLIRHSDDIQFV